MRVLLRFGVWVLLAGFCLAQAQLPRGARRLPVIDKQDIRFVRLSTGGEALNRWVSAITQDNQGFIWLATNDGLYRYDGYTLTQYRHDPLNPDSLSDDNLRTVYVDRSGRLWIGTVSAGLDRLDPSEGVFKHFRHMPGVEGSLSNNNVSRIYQDRSGALWVGSNGGLDLFDASTGTFQHYRHDPNDPFSLTGNEVNAIYEDRHLNFWVGTTRGLNKLDRATGRCQRYVHTASNPRTLGDDFVAAIREDRFGVLWVASVFGDGLSALDVNTGEFRRYSFHSHDAGAEGISGVTSIHEDADGTLWLGAVNDGLLRLDPARKEFVRYKNNALNPNTLHASNVETLFEDREGVLWIGTKTGVSRFSRTSLALASYRHEADNTRSLQDDVIWSVQPDSHGLLWIGTSSGLQSFDLKSGAFRHYRHNPNNPHSISHNTVSAIREDRSGKLWFGTYGGGLNSFDRITGKYSAFRSDPTRPGSLSSNLIQCLLVDHEGNLWVGTQTGGLNRYDTRTGRFKTYRNNPADPRSLPHDNVRALFEDRAGTLWVGTVSGGLSRFDRMSEQFTSWSHDPGNPGSLSHQGVASIHQDQQGTLWIGTRDGLNRMDPSGRTFTRFTMKDGLPDHYVEAILEDHHGDLWLATHYGLSRFSPRTGRFQNYTESDGLPSNYMNPNGMEAACQLPGGEMVFGSTDGLTIFDPEKVIGNRYVPPVVLTDFLLFNRPVPVSGKSPLRRPIWATSALTLDHTQNIFTIEFAALSYAAPERNRYRYRLEGLENRWNEVDGKRRVATYTSLPPGKYIFRVQGSNNNLLWNTTGVSLPITVLPPWWKTWWFSAALITCLLVLIYLVHRLRVRNLHISAAKLELQVTQRTRDLETAWKEAEIAKNAAESANRTKSAFLSHMSHELRTPLNAILGFASLLREGVTSPKQRADLDIISRSGEHLLGLIDDVLDVARIEAGRSVVEIEPCDLMHVVREVTDMVRTRASAKGLALLVDQASDLPRFVQTDVQKLRQVLLNLLGNAVKFTDKGKVTLRLRAAPDAVSDQWLLTFEVEDTGPGIDPADQSRIFEPFIQAGKASRQQGTGLGLAITRQFVEMLGGSIRVNSTRGVGSVFHVEIPAAQAEQGNVAEPRSRLDYVLENGQPDYRILVVDDEADNRSLLERLLRKAGFQVEAASGGAEGIEIFEHWRPQFIWTDLRMPIMDGLEMAQRIRKLDGGKDVKIVAISASADATERARVLAAGMNDFLRKPYRASEVFECIAQHLGASYIVDQQSPAPAVEPASTTLLPEDFSMLPCELRTELAQAVMSVDPVRVRAVIGAVAGHDPALASKLSFHAERFAFSAIYHALNGAQERSASL